MSVRLSQLPSALSAEDDHVLPASRLGSTVGLSVAQIVARARAEILDGSPEALDTLNELAAALGDDANFAATMVAALAGKLSADGSVAWAGDQDADGNSLDNLLNLNGRSVDTLQSRMGAWTEVAHDATVPLTDGLIVYTNSGAGSRFWLPDIAAVPVGWTVRIAPPAGAPGVLSTWPRVSAQSGQTIFTKPSSVADQEIVVPPSGLLWFRKGSGNVWVWGEERTVGERVLQSGHLRDGTDYSTASGSPVQMGPVVYVTPMSPTSFIEVSAWTRLSLPSGSLIEWNWFDGSSYVDPQSANNFYASVSVAGGSEVSQVFFGARFTASERRTDGTWTLAPQGYSTSGTITSLEMSYVWREIEVYVP